MVRFIKYEFLDIINPLHPGRNRRQHLVRNGLQHVAQHRYGEVVAEELDAVALLAIDAGDVNHADIHADIPHVGRTLAVDQAVGVAVAQAAVIAAYYSQGREGGKVPVDYTMLRFVRKPSGALPGKVIYTDYKTIMTGADEALVKRLKK